MKNKKCIFLSIFIVIVFLFSGCNFEQQALEKAKDKLNVKKANAVIDKIAEIGQVTLDEECFEKISKAQEAYLALDGEQRALVENANALVQAIADYNVLFYKANVSEVSVHVLTYGLYANEGSREIFDLWQKPEEQFNANNESVISKYIIIKTKNTIRYLLEKNRNKAIKAMEKLNSLNEKVKQSEVAKVFNEFYENAEKLYFHMIEISGNRNAYEAKRKELYAKFMESNNKLKEIYPEYEKVSKDIIKIFK